MYVISANEKVEKREKKKNAATIHQYIYAFTRRPLLIAMVEVAVRKGSLEKKCAALRSVAELAKLVHRKNAGKK